MMAILACTLLDLVCKVRAKSRPECVALVVNDTETTYLSSLYLQMLIGRSEFCARQY